MRPRGSWNRALKVIDSIYHRMAYVSYIEFKKRWYVGHPPKGGVPPLPSQPTFCRIWGYYKRENGLRTLRGEPLVEWIICQFGTRTLDPDSSKDELRRQAIKIMADQGLVMISRSRFQRALSEASRRFKTLTLLIFSVIFYNVETYAEKLKKAKAPTPVIWDHIQVLGRYRFPRRLLS